MAAVVTSCPMSSTSTNGVPTGPATPPRGEPVAELDAERAGYVPGGEAVGGRPSTTATEAISSSTASGESSGVSSSSNAGRPVPVDLAHVGVVGRVGQEPGQLVVGEGPGSEIERSGLPARSSPMVDSSPPTSTTYRTNHHRGWVDGNGIGEPGEPLQRSVLETCQRSGEAAAQQVGVSRRPISRLPPVKTTTGSRRAGSGNWCAPVCGPGCGGGAPSPRRRRRVLHMEAAGRLGIGDAGPGGRPDRRRSAVPAGGAADVVVVDVGLEHHRQVGAGPLGCVDQPR